jgi:hypothetical protein
MLAVMEDNCEKNGNFGGKMTENWKIFCNFAPTS